MNVLTNAIDAVEERLQGQKKSIQPRIKIQTCTINSEWAEISISNNGCGIPETVQAQIFDSFFTTKPIGKGTGMGMSISYQIIVERYHGKLECFSTPGQETEFIIRIPIHQPDRES